MISGLFAYNIAVEGIRFCMWPASLSSIVCIFIHVVSPMQFYHPVLINVNFVMYAFTLFLYLTYGDGSLSNVKTTGPYHVASKELHLPEGGNPISVFYPMDKHLRDEKLCRYWLHYRQGDKFIKGMVRSLDWIRQTPQGTIPLWYVY